MSNPEQPLYKFYPMLSYYLEKCGSFFFGHLISYIKKKMLSSELAALNKVNLQHPSKQ